MEMKIWMEGERERGLSEGGECGYDKLYLQMEINI